MTQQPKWTDRMQILHAGRHRLNAAYTPPLSSPTLRTGGHLRWEENVTQRALLDAVVDGIEECRDADGYMMAYDRNSTGYTEHPDCNDNAFRSIQFVLAVRTCALFALVRC